jgi:chaperonin GroES
MTFRPLYDRLVVQRREVTEEAHSGIIIPDTAKDKPHEGEVIAVGPGKRRKDGQYQPMSVAVGDFVLFGTYAGAEITLGRDNLLVLRESDVLGVFDR